MLQIYKASLVEMYGKPIGSISIASSFYIPPEHRLVAVMGEGFGRSAVDVTSSEYQEYYNRRCEEGYYSTGRLYLLTEQMAKLCFDEAIDLASG